MCLVTKHKTKRQVSGSIFSPRQYLNFVADLLVSASDVNHADVVEEVGEEPWIEDFRFAVEGVTQAVVGVIGMVGKQTLFKSKESGVILIYGGPIGRTYFFAQ